MENICEYEWIWEEYRSVYEYATPYSDFDKEVDDWVNKEMKDI